MPGKTKTTHLKPSGPKGGRPAIDWNDDLINEINDYLSQGISLCAVGDMPHMPTVQSIMLAVSKDPVLAEKIRVGRRAYALLKLSEIVEIADDTSDDLLVTEKGFYSNTAAVQRSRLRIAVRQYLADRFLWENQSSGEQLGGQRSVTVNLNLLKEAEKIEEIKE